MERRQTPDPATTPERAKNLPDVGFCYYCEEPTPKLGQRFCDDECNAAWSDSRERRQA